MALLHDGIARIDFARRRAFADPLPQGSPPQLLVGGLRLGGSGKTPVAAALARHYAARGLRVALLAADLAPTRSGRGALRRVDPACDPRHESDEALWLAQAAGLPVFAVRNRRQAWEALAAARRADKAEGRERDTPGPLNGAQAGSPAGRTEAGDAEPVCRTDAAKAHLVGEEPGRFDLLISDDGERDGSLRGAFRLMLRGPGENPSPGRSWPAGPYRGGAAARLQAADAVWRGPASAEGDDGVDFLRHTALPEGLDPARPVLALCALGHPARFFADVRACGARPAACLAFRDHGWFRPASLRRLKAEVQRHAGLPWLCSEKDAVSLAVIAREWGFPPPLALRETLEIRPQSLEALDRVLREKEWL